MYPVGQRKLLFSISLTATTQKGSIILCLTGLNNIPMGIIIDLFKRFSMLYHLDNVVYVINNSSSGGDECWCSGCVGSCDICSGHDRGIARRPDFLAAIRSSPGRGDEWHAGVPCIRATSGPTRSHLPSSTQLRP